MGELYTDNWTFDYLNQVKLDERFMEIGRQIDFTGKYIVDLNCGYARLIHYIPHDYEFYLGNDIIEYIVDNLNKSNYPNARFLLLSDERMADFIEKLDILIVCGITDKKFIEQRPEHETNSATLADSVFDIVRKHEPETVVLEAWGRMEADHRLLTKMAGKLKGYKLKYSRTIEGKSPQNRELRIFEHERRV